MSMKNKVQLITYADSLGGSLRHLEEALDECFPQIFEGGIHILPPFPSSGDRGFAPLTYLEIDPALGTWEDIRRLGDRYDIMLDVMVNHISSRSLYFQDFLENGRQSEWADLFITLDKIWPDGKPVQEDINRIFSEGCVHIQRSRPARAQGSGSLDNVREGRSVGADRHGLAVPLFRRLDRRLLCQLLSLWGQGRQARCGGLRGEEARDELLLR